MSIVFPLDEHGRRHRDEQCRQYAPPAGRFPFLRFLFAGFVTGAVRGLFPAVGHLAPDAVGFRRDADPAFAVRREAEVHAVRPHCQPEAFRKVPQLCPLCRTHLQPRRPLRDRLVDRSLGYARTEAVRADGC